MTNQPANAIGNRSIKKTLSIESTAEAYLELLQDRGIKYLFGNGGTDFAPILEGLAKLEARKRATLRPITVPHENVAVSMAHGFYMATGQPQVVMVHVDVGTANAVMAIHNASRTNVPIILIAGRTPLTEEGLPGSRDTFIHWAQESFDQASMLREHVKWDYELRNFMQLETVIDRALEVAMAGPRGPVYLSLPREVLAESHTEISFTSPSRHHSSAIKYPDPKCVSEAVALLADAQNPLIITTAAGQNPDAVTELIALANSFALPVVVLQSRYMNYPTTDPMHWGYDPHIFLDEADVILVLDSDVPWYPSRKKPKDTAHIIHLAHDPFYTRYPIRGYPCDVAIAADPISGIALLRAELAQLAVNSADFRSAIEKRRNVCEAMHRKLREEWESQLEAISTAKPIDERWLSYCIGKVKDDETIVLNEYDLVSEYIQFTKPGTLYTQSPAGGLGWCLGAALGVKLAKPDNTVIAVVGDGSYIFGCPTAAHFVGQAESLPTLTVIFNNGCWNAVRKANQKMYPDGWATKTDNFILSDLLPSPNYEEIVKACGGYGERVDDPEQLISALKRGLEAVRIERRQAVLNVICKHP